MGARKFNFHDGEKGAAIAIRVKRSKGKSGFSKVLKDGTIVLKLAAGENEINARLVTFLARELKIAKGRIQIIAGEDGNKKLISVIDMKPKQIQKMILEKIA